MKRLSALVAAGLAWAAFMVPALAGDKLVMRGTEPTRVEYDGGKWFVADSFSFGVEREMKEGKPGTVTMTLPKDFEGRDELYSRYVNEQPIESMTVLVAKPGETREGKPMVYLRYKLDRCFVKSWSTSGDADDRPTEEVAFYYNKIAFTYAKTTDGKNR